MLYLGLKVMPDGNGGIIQGGQQIPSDIADLGGVLPHAVKDVLDMRLLQPPETVLCRLNGDLAASYADGGAGAATRVGDKVEVRIYYLLPVLLCKPLVLDVLFHFFSDLASIHLSYCDALRWIDRWIKITIFRIDYIIITSVGFSEVCTSGFPKS